MTFLLFLIIGFAAGVLTTLGFAGRLGKREGSVPSTPIEPELPASLTSTDTAQSPDDELLSAKLYRLSSPLESFGDTTAHPAQLKDRAEFTQASDLLSAKDVSVDVVTQYALGANWTLACAAFDALRKRDDRNIPSLQVMAQFARLRPWPMHFALEYFLSLDPLLPAGAPAVGAESWWSENLVIPGLFQSYFARLEKSGAAPEFGNWPTVATACDPEVVSSFLKSLNQPFASALVTDLDRVRNTKLDRGFLESFGRFWSQSANTEPVVKPEEWADLLDAAGRAITHAPARSLIVRGEEKVGKSSFLKLLGDELLAQGWSIFEAGGPELQAGQTYIGQLEERVRRMSMEVVASKKVIWYVPDILQIAVSGTHSGQTASILDQVQQALSSRRMIILSEATPAQITQLVQLKPHLKSIFEVVPLPSLSEERTREVVSTYIKRMEPVSPVKFDAEVPALALQLARQYLDPTQMPGIVFDLVKLAYHHVAAQGAKLVTAADILASLSQVTGLPRAILNAEEKVELATVRRYFDDHVMGQSEAVQQVVDRIAMLKAGLTDPTKPIGVFLFAGPTGTGKTELAKTLAQFLFGSAERLIRLDMSEFKTQDSISKIIGESGSNRAHTDYLINQVRKQPFSVVLLDEFEKAHPHVWDLFLQVFDDGRLTDANGSTADFRHCIIILTSNLGATAHQNSGLGFGERAEEFSSEQIMRSISQSFRPEFVNRLDKVIVFKPLRRELMRQILQKELRNVLERRGLRNREWAVEWESTALEFLLDKGFSAQMGARPLKRAIDQYLLAPLAATIVEHRIPQGDQFLFVRSDGKSIQVEFVDPDADRAADPTSVSGGTLELAAIMLQAYGNDAERGSIAHEQRLIDLRLGSDEWQALHTKLGLQMSDSSFWNQPERFKVLSRFALMDRIKAAAKTADALRERLDKSRDRSGSYSNELMGRLARQIFALKAGIADVLTDTPVETIVRVEPALDASGDASGAPAWCQQLLGMYRKWANRRGMQLVEHVLDGTTYLLVSGFGAHRTLMDESGLHVLETGDEDSATSRVVARVRAVASPPGEFKTSNAAQELKRLIESGSVPSQVIRRYRGGDAALVRDARQGWRSGKFEQTLGGDFDLIGATASRT